MVMVDDEIIVSGDGADQERGDDASGRRAVDGGRQ